MNYYDGLVFKDIYKINVFVIYKIWGNRNSVKYCFVLFKIKKNFERIYIICILCIWWVVYVLLLF